MHKNFGDCSILELLIFGVKFETFSIQETTKLQLSLHKRLLDNEFLP